MKMIPIETTVRRNEHKPGSSGTSERKRSESEWNLKEKGVKVSEIWKKKEWKWMNEMGVDAHCAVVKVSFFLVIQGEL